VYHDLKALEQLFYRSTIFYCVLQVMQLGVDLLFFYDAYNSIAI
jgi:hypothetical protein